MTRSLDKARGILSPKSISGGPLGGFRNKLINGDFDIWQRGTSQTLSGYGSDDRWQNAFSGGSFTNSRQEFTLGQTDVPGNPRYFARCTVVGGTGASELAIKMHKMENVLLLAGKQVTLTYYAKASAAAELATSFEQNFGSGGSPSAHVQAISPVKVSLTTSWQKFTRVVTIPSVAGKTLGTAGNDNLNLIFWLSSGSDYNHRNDSLGPQTATIDIAHVSLVEGDATLEDDPFEPRHIQQELELCMRYFENGEYNIFGVNYVTNAASFYNSTQFKVRKRATPTISISAGTSFLFGGISTNQISVSQFSHYAQGTTTAAGTGYYAMSGWSADAEL